MKIMEKQQSESTIYDLSYPCYLAGIPENSNRIIHISGLYEYKELYTLSDFVIEGYKTKDKFYLFDCMPSNLWHLGVCNLEYYKRLKDLRRLIAGEIADYRVVSDLPMVDCIDPFEAKEYLKNLKEQGFKKVRVMYMNGYYVFGESKNDEYVELLLD